MPSSVLLTEVRAEAVSRGHHYAAKARAVGFNPVGEVVGCMNDIRSARRVIEDMVGNYPAATEGLQALLPEG